MNVQITPLQTPPVRDSQRDDEPGGRGRTYVIGGAALALALGGFWYFTHESQPQPRRAMAAPVRIATVETGNMAVIERTIGTVMANSTVQVNARIQGQMLQAFFKEGQMVKAGDLLFQIDPRPYQAMYDNALAAEATAKVKAERYSRLAEQNAIAGQSYDDAQAAYLQAKATSKAAQLNLEYTTIRAPISGKTGPILIQPGNMIAAATASTTASSLVTINEIQPVKISLSLPQSDLPRIQARAQHGGLTAMVNLHDAGGQDLTAPVDFISNAVSNSAGTIELRATFPNMDGALVPGQLVDVTVALDSIKNAIVVPRVAVNLGPDSQYVYVVTPDHVVVQHTAKVLFDDGTMMAIQSDVKPGEMVIVDGALRALPGGKVSVARARAAGAPAGAPNADKAAAGGKRAEGKRPGAAAE